MTLDKCGLIEFEIIDKQINIEESNQKLKPHQDQEYHNRFFFKPV